MAHYAVVSRVEPDSIAAELGIQCGDKIITVNGQPVKDIIELSFALADEFIEITVENQTGIHETYEIEKNYDDDLGIEFESAVFDGIKQCGNCCVFCFVDQMPNGLRESLYVKDDDYRLSFLYGNFITLTNLGPTAIKDIIRLHLSPLYISVHTTNPNLRTKMIGTKKAADMMETIKTFLANGIEIHTQVVLCPGINDNDELAKTIADLYAYHPQILSLAIVPVGLTRFRENCYPLTPINKDYAVQVIQQIEAWQQQCREQTGKSFVYLADEFYLKADVAIPSYEFYDEFPQIENGVGIVRSFLWDWEQIPKKIAVRYHLPVYLDVVCGASAEKVLQKLLNELAIPNLYIRIVPVENHFFGTAITVTGLLTGQDVVHALSSLSGPRTGVILPGIALRKGEEIMLDGYTPTMIAEKLQIPIKIARSAQDLYELLCSWQ